jgi:hypothetical protein
MFALGVSHEVNFFLGNRAHDVKKERERTEEPEREKKKGL